MEAKKGRPRVCSHCHKGLSAVDEEKGNVSLSEAIETETRAYCERCSSLGNMQESWRPLPSGTVTAMYVIDDKGRVTGRGAKNKNRES